MSYRKDKNTFDQLNLKEKGKQVFLYHGSFVAERNYYNQKTVLYSMGDFFAEVWYDSFTNSISDITSLSPESDKINLYIKENTSK